MLNVKTKNKARLILSQGQNRLLKDSLKQLLGSGLVQNRPDSSRREDRLSFLKDALNAKILDKEFVA